jgi:hypothetical protein
MQYPCAVSEGDACVRSHGTVYLGQIYIGIVISVILLAVPFVGVFYGWSEWHIEIVNGKLSDLRRVAACIRILVITTQSVLFVAVGYYFQAIGYRAEYSKVDSLSALLMRPGPAVESTFPHNGMARRRNSVCG